jgi:hypothetical protein
MRARHPDNAASKRDAFRCQQQGGRLDPQVSIPSRTLLYIPILHTQADMGDLGASLQRIKASTLGRRRLTHSAELVDNLWKEIERTVERLHVAPGSTRVYQDGLPVCAHEARIVSELAEAGSRNYKLLLRLESQGAILMGTESPELLVEEYQLAITALHSGGGGDARRRELRGAALLEKRDRYIAARINSTLQPGETGILFLGMLHAVQPYLEPDIKIRYPVREL